MKALFKRPELPTLVTAILASALLAGALVLPLWRMELVAPQYPEGLVMRAYGYKFAEDPDTHYDDVREINGLNHYIGMKPIKEVPEMRLFIPGVAALIAGTLLMPFLAWQAAWFRRLIIAGLWTMPLFFIADLQYWLYNYGHTMDPEAALDMDPFTPKVFGETSVWNFHSRTAFEAGFYLMVAAAVTITFAPAARRLLRRLRAAAPSGRRAGRAGQRAPIQTGASALKVALPLALAAGAVLAAQGRTDAFASAGVTETLQERIDAAAPEDIIVVDGGVYRENIIVNKPVSLIGRNWPVIDGGGEGDVVTVTADDAMFSGFEVRNSGRSLSTEPAAIKVAEADRVTISGNRVRESHFALHMSASEGSTIKANDFRAGTGVAEGRRGHGIYLWKVSGSLVYRNMVRDAADGIHLEFSDDNLIAENEVRESRYALHFMYAHGNRIVRNATFDNLAGAVLMFSQDLIVKDNEFSSNRDGASGAGMLLKDDDNIYVEGNRFFRNKYGMTVEGTPQGAGATAIFRRNTYALNDVGLALTSNSPVTFVENAVIDNGVQVKALSGDLMDRSAPGHGGGDSAAEDGKAVLPQGAVWSSEGRGNYWSDYRGYDADGDGVGDQPYLPRPAFGGRLADDDTLRLFQFTPAQQALDMAVNLFPVYRYDAVIEDGSPLMRPPAGLTLEHREAVNRRMLVTSALLLAGSVVAIFWLSGAERPRLIRAGGAARHAAGA